MKRPHDRARQTLKNPESALRAVQDKFHHFTTLLDRHHHILRLSTDLEEKAQGEFLFDINYIRSSIQKLQSNLDDLVEAMIALGGDQYAPLRERATAVVAAIEQAVPGTRGILPDELALPINQINRERARSVGSKMAQLGEMKARLGLPVPDGFAVSAWAYKRIIDANDLQSRINRLIESLNFTRYADLVSVSRRIRRFIKAAILPQDVAEAIWAQYNAFLSRRPNRRLAVRSSALGEDSLYSFAGQYASFLNVRGEELIDKYRDVLISAFTPQAIYYFLSHSFTPADLAMSAGCVEMIDAAAAGVIYTHSPVNSRGDCVLVSAVRGLGKYLVEGRITPDSYCVSRDTGEIEEQTISQQQIQLVLNQAGGTVEVPVDPELAGEPVITEEQLKQLVEYALKIEEHYDSPQDIEWALDYRGRIFFLQTRPLRIAKPETSGADVDTSRLNVLLEGGVTVSSGIGGGPVFHAGSMEDLQDLPDNAVLVTPNSFPGIITVMEKVSAIVTGVGGVANHMATIAREYEVPTLGGLKQARDLESGKPVTVDAVNGVIYDGIQEELIKSHRPEKDLLGDMAIFTILESVLHSVVPLHVVHPDSDDFTIENCRTVHDISRYVHQKAIEEMFSGALAMKEAETAQVQLKTEMPMQVNIVYLDREPPKTDRKGMIPADQLDSVPMEAFWSGVKSEGWPRASLPPHFKTLKSPTLRQQGLSKQAKYRDKSYVILSREYMVFNVHMGYHFASVEAMATEEPTKNYIRMQYKDGGAPLDRRIRRIKLVAGILKHLGFENLSSQDYLNAVISYVTLDEATDKLALMGRLTMMTKQLDMALSSDAVAEWYERDMLRKLGFKDPGRDQHE